MLPLTNMLLIAARASFPVRQHRVIVACVEQTLCELEQFRERGRRRSTLVMTVLGVLNLNGVAPLTPSPRTPRFLVLSCRVLIRTGFCMLQWMRRNPPDRMTWCTGSSSLLVD